MKPLLLVNPRSGGGKTGALFETMRAPLEHGFGAFDVSFTERPRHAVDLAREAALAGREVVVAVGGDGSIHEVVNGLMQARAQGASGTKLGIVGAGTGGDFTKSLGIEHRLDRYAATIAAGKTRAVDVGSFRYRSHDGKNAESYFVNILSVGLGGLVDRYVADGGRAFGGTVAYFSASVRALVNSAIGHLECTFTNGTEERKELLETRSIAICNGRFFGSGMMVAPMAKIDDGFFDVVDLGAAPKLKFALSSSKVYSGEHMKNPETKHFRCNRAKLVLVNTEVNDRFLLDVDGEPLGTLPLDIECVAGAINVFAPA